MPQEFLPRIDPNRPNCEWCGKEFVEEDDCNTIMVNLDEPKGAVAFRKICGQCLADIAEKGRRQAMVKDG